MGFEKLFSVRLDAGLACFNVSQESLIEMCLAIGVDA
jgi:hypothetical protein